MTGFLDANLCKNNLTMLFYLLVPIDLQILLSLQMCPVLDTSLFVFVYFCIN